mmetsp:Transcript_4905/g.6383  ORF Transcript_4905/g.6383 Transcript_4905/m.6383 type:complete len:111 (-) Transcript_4905:93-425(-)
MRSWGGQQLHSSSKFWGEVDVVKKKWWGYKRKFAKGTLQMSRRKTCYYNFSKKEPFCVSLFPGRGNAVAHVGNDSLLLDVRIICTVRRTQSEAFRVENKREKHSRFGYTL